VSTGRWEDTPARRETRERTRPDYVNNEDRAELIKLINAKLCGQQRRDAFGFVKNRMRTMAQAENLTKRLESL
jgi:hypothetical protein